LIKVISSSMLSMSKIVVTRPSILVCVRTKVFCLESINQWKIFCSGYRLGRSDAHKWNTEIFAIKQKKEFLVQKPEDLEIATPYHRVHLAIADCWFS
jgi:hypothetical protein